MIFMSAAPGPPAVILLCSSILQGWTLKLRTHVSLIVASLSAAFVILAAWLQFDGTRRAVREEIAGANVSRHPAADPDPDHVRPAERRRTARPSCSTSARVRARENHGCAIANGQVIYQSFAFALQGGTRERRREYSLIHSAD